MRLVTNAEVRERRSTLKNVTEVNDAIDDALEGTTPYLEGALGTVFAEATLKDVFYVDLTSNPPEGQFSFLKLKQGFVSVVATVRQASLLSELAAAPPLLVDIDYTVKAEQGLIAMHKTSTRDSEVIVFENESLLGDNFYIQVDYTAGFGDTGGLFDSVPDWLKEAAVVYAIVVLNTQSPIKPMEKLDEVTREILKHLKIVIDSRKRSFGTAIRPVL